MIRQTSIIIAFLLFAVQNASAQQPTPKPSPTPSSQRTSAPRSSAITGRILTDDGQPLATAQITINPVSVSVPASGRPLVTIDAQGNFHSSNLTPGSYTVSVSAPGYVRASISPGSLEYGRYQPGDVITITMVKGGVITGQVTNERGEPVAAAYVRAIFRRVEEGFAGGASPADTDDRGVYRLFGLPPGTYIIAVNDYPFQFSPPSPYSRLMPTYYPSATRATATEVTVHRSEEVTGIDIRFRGEPGRTISGTVTGVDSFAGASNPRLEVSLADITNRGQTVNNLLSRNARDFDFYGLPDGEYVLRADYASGEGHGAASQPQHVTVKGADVKGLELSLLPLPSLSGRLVVEALPPRNRPAACATARIASLQDIRISPQLDEAGNLSNRPSVSWFPLNNGVTNAQGEFIRYKLSPGHYRILAPSANQPWYIRSITLPGTARTARDVGRDGLTLNLGEHMTGLIITVAEGAATLRGQVVADKAGARLPSRLQVHAVPTEHARTDDLLRYAQTFADPNGKFLFNDLAPGKYWLLVRAVPEGVFTARPVAWDGAERAKLRREAEAAKIEIGLKPCQRVSEFKLQYPASTTNK